LSSSGLGSKVSTCEGPPFRKRWTTRCAFAGKCGGRGASGFVSAGAARAEEGSRPSSASKPVSPNRPKPSPLRRSNSRRVSGSGPGWSCAGGILVDSLEQAVGAAASWKERPAHGRLGAGRNQNQSASPPYSSKRKKANRRVPRSQGYLLERQS